MIVTLTANPSIDVTLDVPEFHPDEVNRAVSKCTDPAGKGINVSRALAKNGVDTAAIFPADPVSGRWLELALNAEGIDTLSSPIAAEIRTNMIIEQANGQTTTVNEPGPRLTPHEHAALVATVESVLASKPAWLVMGGSLPLGLDSRLYRELAEVAHSLGVRVAIDTSGNALSDVAHAGVADLLKPNHEELEELAGHPLPTVGDVTTFAHSLLRDSGAAILVSLGEHGALLVTDHDTLWAGHAPVTVDGTVGAGDSCLAGYLSAYQQAEVEHLDSDASRRLMVSTAVAWGSACVRLPGTTVPGPGDITINLVSVLESPDPTTRVEEL